MYERRINMTTLVKLHYSVMKDKDNGKYYIASAKSAEIISQAFFTEEEAISWINYAIANDIDDSQLADVIQDFYTL